MIRIALAKGRISQEAFMYMRERGVDFSGDDTRRLSIPDKTGRYEVLLVKPADTAVYVQRGVADCGIVGRDILVEDDPDVYSLYSLPFATCRMCVAGPPGALDGPQARRRVRAATKYPRTAAGHFLSKGLACDVIRLNGSVELAPLLSLSDVIVDIVQTGGTLRENGLVVLEEMFPVYPVFIVNEPSLKIKNNEIMRLAGELGLA